MIEIVKRLRKRKEYGTYAETVEQLCKKAADEIERLELMVATLMQDARRAEIAND